MAKRSKVQLYEQIRMSHERELSIRSLAEHFGVMGIGPHRIWSSPPNDELQELVDQLVADPVLMFAIGTDVILERRTPLHRTPPARVCTRESLGCLSQEVDHLYNRRTGAP